MTYAEKLKDPRWQKKRLEVLSRDNFTCKLCQSSEKTLHVHHKRYSKTGNPWDVDLIDLSTYCEGCHSIVEKLKKMVGDDLYAIQYFQSFEKSFISIRYFFGEAMWVCVAERCENDFEVLFEMPISFFTREITNPNYAKAVHGD